MLHKKEKKKKKKETKIETKKPTTQHNKKQGLIIHVGHERVWTTSVC